MILHNVNFYHNMLNDYMLQDIKNCNYNYYQHNINFYNYVKNIKDFVNSTFDYNNDNYIDVTNYLNKRLNDTITEIEYYNRYVKVS